MFVYPNVRYKYFNYPSNQQFLAILLVDRIVTLLACIQLKCIERREEGVHAVRKEEESIRPCE